MKSITTKELRENMKHIGVFAKEHNEDLLVTYRSKPFFIIKPLSNTDSTSETKYKKMLRKAKGSGTVRDEKDFSDTDKNAKYAYLVEKHVR